MNPTKLSFNQSADEFAKTTGFQVELCDPNRVPVPGTQRTVDAAAVAHNADTDTVTCDLPSDLFEGIPSSNYIVGVRPVNAGGASTWVFSEPFSVIGEPSAITNVVVS